MGFEKEIMMKSKKLDILEGIVALIGILFLVYGIFQGSFSQKVSEEVILIKRYVFCVSSIVLFIMSYVIHVINNEH